MKKIVVLFVFILLSSSASQEILKLHSELNINFGAGKQIEDIFIDNNILYTFVRKNTSDLDPWVMYNNFAVGIFDISNPNQIIELGRKDNNFYVGNPNYKDRVKFFDSTEIGTSYYSVSLEDEPTKHYNFWFNFKIIQFDSTFYVFKDYEKNLKTYIYKGNGDFELKSVFTLNNDLKSITGMALVDSTIYLTSSAGFFLFDVSETDTLIELANQLHNINSKGIIVGENRAILSQGFYDICLLDISDSKNPFIIDNERLFHHYLIGMYDDKKFYLSGFVKSIAIFDEELNKINQISTKGNISALKCNDSFVYSSSNLGLELFKIDINDNVFPKSAYGANISEPENFIKIDSLIYVSGQGDGVSIIKISDTFIPELISTLDYDGFAKEIAVDGEYIYVADYLKGLVIIDIKTKAEPIILSSLPSLETASSIDVENNKAFVVTEEGILFIIDITDKTNPNIICENNVGSGHENYFGHYKKVRVVNNNIWLKFEEMPLKAYSYSNQSCLTELFSYQYEYSSLPIEMNIQDSVMFFTNFNGIQILNPHKFSFIREEIFGNISMEMSPKSLALNSAKDILYVSYAIFGISSIMSFNVSELQNPKYLRGSFPLGYASKTMVFEDDLLYLLTPNGIKICSPFITDIKNKESNYIPTSFSLSQNYPNPFNPTTTIGYTVPSSSVMLNSFQHLNDSEIPNQVRDDNYNVSLIIYDILGRKVKILVNHQQNPGKYSVQFNAENLSSGIYYYQLKSGNYTETKKMILLR